MKLYIKQQVFTLGEKFYVKDENGNDVFYIQGSFLKIPKHFKIFDMQGNQLVLIERQLFRILPRYDIQIDGHIHTLKKDFTFFRRRYYIDTKDWEIQGDFLSHEYEINHGRQTIMNITKHWFTWGDSYEIYIPNKEDILLSLATIIAIDADLAQSSGSNSSAS